MFQKDLKDQTRSDEQMHFTLSIEESFYHVLFLVTFLKALKQN